MKALIIGIFFFISTNTFSTNYYVDALKGNDVNSGASANNAWQSIDKVNNAQLLPGDSVLFKRGETFRGNLIPKSGSEAGPMTYADYGTGIKPKIFGSSQLNLSNDWENAGVNIWQISSKSNKNVGKIFNDIGNIIFNNEEFCGIKVKNDSDLNAQGKFWFDKDNHVLKIFSVINPASFYSNIEIAFTRNIIDESNKSYITYQNLDLRYCAAHGIGGGNTHHINVKNVDISYIGGGFLNGYGDGKVRYGNGIEFWGIAHDNIVERCTFNQIYDAALTAQGESKAGYETYNIYFRNNIIRNCEYSFELWGRGPDSYLHDIYFENNTCLNAGSGWGHVQRPDPNGAHLMLREFTARSKNVFIRNNIFSESSNYSSRYGNASDLSKMVVDYNCWYQSAGPIAKIGNTYFDFKSQWSEYQKASNQDAHSIAADPLLKSNFTLSNNSPSIGTGVIVQSVNDDFNRTNRQQTGKTDIGAFIHSSNEK